jgi:hypothetical protein
LFIEQALGLASEPTDSTAPNGAVPATQALPESPPLATMPAARASAEQLAAIAGYIEATVAQSAQPVPAGWLASRLRQEHAPQGHRQHTSASPRRPIPGQTHAHRHGRRPA